MEAAGIGNSSMSKVRGRSGSMSASVLLKIAPALLMTHVLQLITPISLHFAAETPASLASSL